MAASRRAITGQMCSAVITIRTDYCHRWARSAVTQAVTRHMISRDFAK